MSAPAELVTVNGNGHDTSAVEDKLARYAPEGVEPRQWLHMIKTQIMGTDKQGRPRPTADLLLFLYTCNRLQLDPMARQIYAVYRGDYRTGTDKMAIQVSIDGMRLIAERTGWYGGQDDATFDPADEAAEHPRKATVTVFKVNKMTGERMPTTKSARWTEYNGTGPMWKRMPYLMLAKCAEALALRAAFPQELSGVYTEEEMAQADNAAVPRQQPQLQSQSQSTAVDGQYREVHEADGGPMPLNQPANELPSQEGTPAETTPASAETSEATARKLESASDKHDAPRADTSAGDASAGNGRRQSLRPPKNAKAWTAAITTLAQDVPQYAYPNGKPNAFRVLQAAQEHGLYPIPEDESAMMEAINKLREQAQKGA